MAFVPDPEDLRRIREEHWYRIPLHFAPKGLHAEYVAFYFGNNFGVQKWAIHYFARNLGHELTTRRTLLPEQRDHIRADELYYKVQLGDLQTLQNPIISMRWRRVSFIHTTWDRFQDATEINDLFVDGDLYVDRLYATLRERGIQAERNYRVEESTSHYIVPLAIPGPDGMLGISHDMIPRHDKALHDFVEELERIRPSQDAAQTQGSNTSQEREQLA